jgi:long-subunit acyl-CoA synthetase (AMP-forming)
MTRRTLEPLILGIEEEVRLTDPEFRLSIEEIPPLLEIYPNLGVETTSSLFQPYAAGAEKPSLDDICMYMHSSGTTTGVPKPIAHTHRTIIQFARFGVSVISVARVSV